MSPTGKKIAAIGIGVLRNILQCDPYQYQHQQGYHHGFMFTVTPRMATVIAVNSINPPIETQVIALEPIDCGRLGSNEKLEWAQMQDAVWCGCVPTQNKIISIVR